MLCVCGLIGKFLIDTGDEFLQTATSQRGNTDKATPVKTSTPAPTPTPIFWDNTRQYPQPVPGLYQQLLDNKKSMTDIQFNDYLASIIGERIHMKARIIEVSENNTILLSATEGRGINSITLLGLSREILVSLNKEQIIEFDATIKDFSVFIFTSIDLDDLVIYSVK